MLENNISNLVAATTASIFENCLPLSLNNQPDNLPADEAGGIRLSGLAYCWIALPILNPCDCKILQFNQCITQRQLITIGEFITTLDRVSEIRKE